MYHSFLILREVLPQTLLYSVPNSYSLRCRRFAFQRVLYVCYSSVCQRRNRFQEIASEPAPNSVTAVDGSNASSLPFPLEYGPAFKQAAEAPTQPPASALSLQAQPLPAGTDPAVGASPAAHGLPGLLHKEAQHPPPVRPVSSFPVPAHPVPTSASPLSPRLAPQSGAAQSVQSVQPTQSCSPCSPDTRATHTSSATPHNLCQSVQPAQPRATPCNPHKAVQPVQPAQPRTARRSQRRSRRAHCPEE